MYEFYRHMPHYAHLSAITSRDCHLLNHFYLFGFSLLQKVTFSALYPTLFFNKGLSILYQSHQALRSALRSTSVACATITENDNADIGASRGKKSGTMPSRRVTGVVASSEDPLHGITSLAGNFHLFKGMLFVKHLPVMFMFVDRGRRLDCFECESVT